MGRKGCVWATFTGWQPRALQTPGSFEVSWLFSALQIWTLSFSGTFSHWPGRSHHASTWERRLPLRHSLHHPGTGHCSAGHPGEHPGLLGSLFEQQLAERHQLLCGVPGCRWHRRGRAGNPLCHHHQHWLLCLLLWLPFHCLLCPGLDSEFDLQPPRYCHWQNHCDPHTPQVSRDGAAGRRVVTDEHQ